MAKTLCNLVGKYGLELKLLCEQDLVQELVWNFLLRSLISVRTV